MNNQELSLSEECQQIKELLKKASTSIRKEIRETFGAPPACEKRHGGGSVRKVRPQNGANDVGQGANSGGNGGFGQQRGNFGGQNGGSGVGGNNGQGFQ